MAFTWYLHDKQKYPPTLMDFLRWAKKPSKPSNPETLQEYEARMEKQQQNKLEVKHAQPDVKNKYWNEIKSIVNK